MQDLLDQMTARVLRHAGGPRVDTRLPRVAIGVIAPRSQPTVTGCGSGVCLVLQGAKQMLVGSTLLRYGRGTCFASVVDLPTSRIVYESHDGQPYVAASLKVDLEVITALLADLPAAMPQKTAPGFNVAPVSEELLRAWDSHLALLDAPDDIPVLAAGRERELLYRLLQSPHGPLLRQIARHEGSLVQVQRAIEWMRRHFAQPLLIKDLAELAGMSGPSFNRHFKAATGTSPLQYHKTLRLQAARRLLAARTDATRAAYAVGYESPSQFNREYARLFGQPPKKDAAILRGRLGDMSDIMI